MEDQSVFHETNKQDMQEAPDVVTALDETIPSPARIQMEETVELPEIQTMTGYIRRHYEDEILAALTRKIRRGELGVQCGGKLLRETSYTASGNDGKENLSKAPFVIPSDGGATEEAAHHSRNAPFARITPLAGRITWMGFRRVGLYFVEADLTMEAEAEIRSGVPENVRRVTQRYHSELQNENVHYYNGWKTNKAHYVNMKCIIPTYGCFARGYKPDRHGRYKDTLEGLDARGCFQVLDDLEKALDYLDKGETPASDLSTKLQHAANSGRTTVSCKYFMVTFYKKGTCHIKFHDQKIVDRLNIYVGRQRAWLPPTYGSVRYDQMDEESKRIVDEFQGREKYEAVINCPNDYIIETKAAPLLLM